MSTIWVAASRRFASHSKPYSNWLLACATRIEQNSLRQYSSCHVQSYIRPSKVLTATADTSPKLSNVRHLATRAKPKSKLNPPLKKASQPLLKPRSQAVVKRYEDVPRNYKDQTGLPFQASSLSADEVRQLYGSGIDVATTNHVMRVIHGRRVAGTLADPSLPGFNPTTAAIALKWLRRNVPVDEEDAAAQRALFELAAMESELVARGESLGLYKPNQGETGQEGLPSGQSVYGRSGLDSIREAYKEKQDAIEETAKKQSAQAAAIQSDNGTQLSNTAQDRASIEPRRPGENELLKYYLAKAAAVAPQTPPEMSTWERLWPSSIVLLLVLGGGLLFTQIYVPPSKNARLWSDLPPAAATIITLMLVNLAICMLWHFPPAFATLNKYFLSVPGYPRALAVIGNVFSHQSFSHLASNMFVLWFIGTRLHDDIGRANFLALYFGAGAFSSFTSLAIQVYIKNFAHTTLGASGAVAGLMAFYLYLHAFEWFRFFDIFPPEPVRGIPGYAFLVGILGLELAAYRRVMLGNATWKFDHYSHFGGYVAGVSGAMLFKRHERQKEAIRLEKQRQRTELFTQQPN